MRGLVGRGRGDGAAGGFFAETPHGTRFAAASFAELHLSRPLLKAVAELGYTRTTPIQARRRDLGLSSSVCFLVLPAQRAKFGCYCVAVHAKHVPYHDSPFFSLKGVEA